MHHSWRNYYSPFYLNLQAAAPRSLQDLVNPHPVCLIHLLYPLAVRQPAGLQASHPHPEVDPIQLCFLHQPPKISRTGGDCAGTLTPAAEGLIPGPVRREAVEHRRHQRPAPGIR